jgi:hypothetical protein
MYKSPGGYYYTYTGNSVKRISKEQYNGHRGGGGRGRGGQDTPLDCASLDNYPTKCNNVSTRRKGCVYNKFTNLCLPKPTDPDAWDISKYDTLSKELTDRLDVFAKRANINTRWQTALRLEEDLDAMNRMALAGDTLMHKYHMDKALEHAKALVGESNAARDITRDITTSKGILQKNIDKYNHSAYIAHLNNAERSAKQGDVKMIDYHLSRIPLEYLKSPTVMSAVDKIKEIGIHNEQKYKMDAYENNLQDAKRMAVKGDIKMVKYYIDNISQLNIGIDTKLIEKDLLPIAHTNASTYNQQQLKDNIEKAYTSIQSNKKQMVEYHIQRAQEYALQLDQDISAEIKAIWFKYNDFYDKPRIWDRS